MTTFQLSIPLASTADVPAGYRTRHLDVHLDNDQAEQLRRITEGLDQRQARLKNGRRVCKIQDAVRWLLEQTPALPE